MLCIFLDFGALFLAETPWVDLYKPMFEALSNPKSETLPHHFPVGDGGREVHELHVALELHGYYSSEDDRLWWQFGDPTYHALITFQVGFLGVYNLELQDKI